jgi:hypothetical protein
MKKQLCNAVHIRKKNLFLKIKFIHIEHKKLYMNQNSIFKKIHSK